MSAIAAPGRFRSRAHSLKRCAEALERTQDRAEGLRSRAQASPHTPHVRARATHIGIDGSSAQARERASEELAEQPGDSSRVWPLVQLGCIGAERPSPQTPRDREQHATRPNVRRNGANGAAHVAPSSRHTGPEPPQVAGRGWRYRPSTARFLGSFRADLSVAGRTSRRECEFRSTARWVDTG